MSVPEAFRMSIAHHQLQHPFSYSPSVLIFCCSAIISTTFLNTKHLTVSTTRLSSNISHYLSSQCSTSPSLLSPPWSPLPPPSAKLSSRTTARTPSTSGPSAPRSAKSRPSSLVRPRLLPSPHYAPSTHPSNTPAHRQVLV